MAKITETFDGIDASLFDDIPDIDVLNARHAMNTAAVSVIAAALANKIKLAPGGLLDTEDEVQAIKTLQTLRRDLEHLTKAKQRLHARRH